MKNFIQLGAVLTATLAVAVVSGDLVIIGALPAVASGNYGANVEGEYELAGVYELAALPAATGVIGGKAYWDATNKRVTSVAVDNTLVGVYWKEKVAAATTAVVRLSGIPV
jgi:predicted RecA/RadA family phage recombinase